MKRMSFADYCKTDAINWSTLKEMRRSPLHYRHRLEHPREDSTRLAMGRACHTAILEMRRFLIEYALFDGERRAGKAWEQFKEMHAGKTILKSDEYDQCLAVADAVRANQAAAEYLRDGDAESTMVWTDPSTKLQCKGRPDFISRSKPAIVDVKTTGDISANRFGTVAARMGYHIQAAFYQAGYAALTGQVLPCITVAVEMEPPHDVAVYRIDDDSMYAGEQEYMRLLADVAACHSNGKWPGRFQDEQLLRLPAWAVGDDEEDVGGLDLLISGQNTGG